MTDVYEGSLIRVFRRLVELIRQMAQAAKVMGSEDLEQKFEISLTKVMRGMSSFSQAQGAATNKPLTFHRHRCYTVIISVDWISVSGVLCVV